MATFLALFCRALAAAASASVTSFIPQTGQVPGASNTLSSHGRLQGTHLYLVAAAAGGRHSKAPPSTANIANNESHSLRDSSFMTSSSPDPKRRCAWAQAAASG